jgi:hypothetical protein
MGDVKAKAGIFCYPLRGARGFVVRLLELTRTFEQGGGSGTQRTKAFWQFGQTVDADIQLGIDTIRRPFHRLQTI